MTRLEELRKEYSEFERRHARVATLEQKAQILALAEDFPRLWAAPTTPAKDRKRMLRLLIQDITVERPADQRVAILHIRWQGGPCEDMTVELPRSIAERIKYPETLLERIRQLCRAHSNAEIAALLNKEQVRSPRGKPFKASMVQWVRYRYSLPTYEPAGLSVKQVAQRLGVSIGVVYYWLDRNIIPGRKEPSGRYRITLDEATEQQLRDRVRHSTRLQRNEDVRNYSVGGAL